MLKYPYVRLAWVRSCSVRLISMQGTQHIALMTFVFPDSLPNVYPRTAPLADEVPLPNNTTAHPLPTTLNPLSPISQDTTLAFSVPFGEAADFLDTVKELPNGAIFHRENGKENTYNRKTWAIKTTKNSGQASPSTIRSRASNAWTGLLDLLKVR